MPYLHDAPSTRFATRLAATMGRHLVREARGLEHIAPAADPFVLAANHSQRMEAVLLPSALIFSRRGKLVHFMADWPTLLVPIAGFMLRAGQVITVTSKRARFKPLNLLKPLFDNPVPAFDRALAMLKAGSSVGIFAEGTMNRHPTRLLRGQTGAAKLALRAGVPIVPVGIRFPDQQPDKQIKDTEPMTIEFGPPIAPLNERGEDKPSKDDIRSLHQTLMSEIARLSGKRWNTKAQRRRNHVP
ncbi:MAG: lysophospholipid acyltransferase family protein [Acidobacteriota bacterium]